MSPTDQDELPALEEAFKKLRTEYEKYFAGVERLEPLKERDRVRSVLRRLVGVRTPNTAYRYRLQTLQASYITYESYWNRITRQIEEGTYHRDLFRLAHKQDASGQALREREAPAAVTQDAHGDEGKAPDPGIPAASKPAQGRPQTAYPESLRTLYDALVKARVETGDHRPLAIETLASTVKKQMSAIKEKFKCERVEFAVTIKDGKAILKAIPR